MKFDPIYGLPKVNGADDYADSAHLAGLLAIFNHPQQTALVWYFSEGKYRRHPSEKRYDFSRDQATMLMAGFLSQKTSGLVDTKRIDGKDILPPSVRGLESIAKTGKASWLAHQWLKGEIWWHSNLQPLEEPFQIIALCKSYGGGYLKKWTVSNKLWKWSIRRYLSQLDGSWRNEPELAEWIIEKIEAEA